MHLAPSPYVPLCVCVCMKNSFLLFSLSRFRVTIQFELAYLTAAAAVVLRTHTQLRYFCFISFCCPHSALSLTRAAKLASIRGRGNSDISFASLILAPWLFQITVCALAAITRSINKTNNKKVYIPYKLVVRENCGKFKSLADCKVYSWKTCQERRKRQHSLFVKFYTQK